MSAEILQSSSWVKAQELLRTKQFPFEPSTEIVIIIKLGLATKETDDTTTSMATSATKSTEEPSPQLIPFDKFSPYQKVLRITAYVLRLFCYPHMNATVMSTVV